MGINNQYDTNGDDDNYENAAEKYAEDVCLLVTTTIIMLIT